jgi:hypothetical protein
MIPEVVKVAQDAAKTSRPEPAAGDHVGHLVMRMGVGNAGPSSFHGARPAGPIANLPRTFAPAAPLA